MLVFRNTEAKMTSSTSREKKFHMINILFQSLPYLDHPPQGGAANSFPLPTLQYLLLHLEVKTGHLDLSV